MKKKVLCLILITIVVLFTACTSRGNNQSMLDKKKMDQYSKPQVKSRNGVVFLGEDKPTSTMDVNISFEFENLQ